MRKLLIFIVITGGVAAFAISGLSGERRLRSHTSILNECMSEQAPVHKHVTLRMTYLGRPMPLPANIGVEPDCMRPLDTHDDTSGRIHIHYSREYPFTLGDFFTVWGVIFNKNQFASTIASDRRHIRMKVNGRPDTSFEKYVLRNGDVIQIDVVPGP